MRVRKANLLRRAINEMWDVSKKQMKEIVKELHEAATDSHDPRVRVAAARAIIAMLTSNTGNGRLMLDGMKLSEQRKARKALQAAEEELKRAGQPLEDDRSGSSSLPAKADGPSEPEPLPGTPD